MIIFAIIAVFFLVIGFTGTRLPFLNPFNKASKKTNKNNFPLKPVEDKLVKDAVALTKLQAKVIEMKKSNPAFENTKARYKQEKRNRK